MSDCHVFKSLALLTSDGFVETEPEACTSVFKDLDVVFDEVLFIRILDANHTCPCPQNHIDIL